MEDYIRQRLGKVLGERWRLESVLGVGGMAAVYAAKDGSGREVAVKVLHPEMGMRPEIRDRFMREGYVANKIQHPGVVQVVEHGAVDDWSVFLVMERLVGESLADRVTRLGTLPSAELLDVLDQVLDVLAAAHDVGVVHRDLKPDNLFVLTDGRIKVLDFGLARVLDGTPDDVRTRTGMAMGTMPYMAPEQALGKRSEIDGRVDIFALGATAFRILARRRIHESESEAGMLVAMATTPAPLLLSVAPHVAEPIASIVDLSLCFNRDARYPDARSMQADVRAVKANQPPAFALARRQTRDEPTRVGVVAPVLVGPASAPTPSAAPTVVARLDAPTAVARFDAPTAVARLDAPTAVARLDAPTAVARLDAPTVVAPLDKPTALGLGPPAPQFAPAPQFVSAPGPASMRTEVAPVLPTSGVPVEALASAVSVRGPTVQPQRGRMRGLWIAALALGSTSAAGALWWVLRTPDASADVASEVRADSTRFDAVPASAPRELAANPSQTQPGPPARAAGPLPTVATRAASKPEAPATSAVPSSAAAETAAPAPAEAASPNAPGSNSVQALAGPSAASRSADSAPTGPAAAPAAAAPKVPAPAGPAAPANNEHKPRGKNDHPRGRPGKPDKGF